VKRLFAICCILTLAACSGHRSAPGAHPAAATPARGQTPRVAPEVRVQIGLASEQGVLTLWCHGSRCTRHDSARPKRYLPADPKGLVVFATGLPPAAARVEAGKIARPLIPGTTMAATLDVARGWHTVTLIESWPGYEARWVFGLRA